MYTVALLSHFMPFSSPRYTQLPNSTSSAASMMNFRPRVSATPVSWWKMREITGISRPMEAPMPPMMPNTMITSSRCRAQRCRSSQPEAGTQALLMRVVSVRFTNRV